VNARPLRSSRLVVAMLCATTGACVWACSYDWAEGSVDSGTRDATTTAPRLDSTLPSADTGSAPDVVAPADAVDSRTSPVHADTGDDAPRDTATDSRVDGLPFDDGGADDGGDGGDADGLMTCVDASMCPDGVPCLDGFCGF
jgi:hypothetical protein